MEVDRSSDKQPADDSVDDLALMMADSISEPSPSNPTSKQSKNAVAAPLRMSYPTLNEMHLKQQFFVTLSTFSRSVNPSSGKSGKITGGYICYPVGVFDTGKLYWYVSNADLDFINSIIGNTNSPDATVTLENIGLTVTGFGLSASFATASTVSSATKSQVRVLGVCGQGVEYHIPVHKAKTVMATDGSAKLTSFSVEDTTQAEADTLHKSTAVTAGAKEGFISWNSHAAIGYINEGEIPDFYSALDKYDATQKRRPIVGFHQQCNFVLASQPHPDTLKGELEAAGTNWTNTPKVGTDCDMLATLPFGTAEKTYSFRGLKENIPKPSMTTQICNHNTSDGNHSSHARKPPLLYVGFIPPTTSTDGDVQLVKQQLIIETTATVKIER